MDASDTAIPGTDAQHLDGLLTCSDCGACHILLYIVLYSRVYAVGVSCACYVKWPPGTYCAGSNICPIHTKMNGMFSPRLHAYSVERALTTSSVPLDVSGLLDRTIVDFPLSVASPGQSLLAGPSTSTEENGSGGLEGDDSGRDDFPTSLVGGDIYSDFEQIIKSMTFTSSQPSSSDVGKFTLMLRRFRTSS